MKTFRDLGEVTNVKKNGKDYDKGWNDCRKRVMGMGLELTIDEHKWLLSMSENHSGSIQEAIKIIQNIKNNLDELIKVSFIDREFDCEDIS